MGKDAEQVEAHAVRALSVSAGAFSYQALFDAIPAEVLQAATDPLRRDELVAVCMDDRNPDDGVYSAGGLILLDLSDAIEQIGKLGITAVKSHPGCGAGSVLAQRRGLPASQGDAIAAAQAMLLAREAGVRYGGQSAIDPLSPHQAEATLVFVDSAARRSVFCEYLPPAFFMSGAVYPDREALIAEALLSVTIAVRAAGDSPPRFSCARPFTVAFIGKDSRLLDEAAQVFQARLQAVLPVDVSERVRVSEVQLRIDANAPMPKHEEEEDREEKHRSAEHEATGSLGNLPPEVLLSVRFGTEKAMNPRSERQGNKYAGESRSRTSRRSGQRG